TRFNTEEPAYVSNVVNPTQYMQYRQKSFEDMEKARPVIRKANEEYQQIVGRGYGPVETLQTDDAEIVLVTSGAMTSTARVAIQSIRDRGVRARLLKVNALRPLPTGEVQHTLKHLPRVAALDRNIAIGNEGIWCQQLKPALYPLQPPPEIHGYIAGIC